MPSLNPSNPPSPPSFPPFHLIPGVPNFRDIGGWPILPPSNSHSQHYHVRTSLLYRGSDTNRITHAGIAKLVDLHIKTDFDLRSKQQIEKTGGYVDMREHGIERVWAPVFGEEEYSEERAGERYWLYASEDTGDIVSAFIEILLAGAPMFHTALTHLLSTIPPQSPSSSQLQPPAIFLHCTTGNNRTGVFIALLLLLLHVPHPSIIAEYTLSDLGLAPTRHINVERLLKKGAFGGLSEEERKRKCERMVGARGESMQALLREVQERWGVDGEGYFREVVGLTGEEVERLREAFTVEGPAETGVGYEV